MSMMILGIGVCTGSGVELWVWIHWGHRFVVFRIFFNSSVDFNHYVYLDCPLGCITQACITQGLHALALGWNLDCISLKRAL